MIHKWYTVIVLIVCLGCGRSLTELRAERDELLQQAAALERRIDVMWSLRDPRDKIAEKETILKEIKAKLSKAQEAINARIGR